MIIDIQNKIYSDNNLRRFLYEESYWYKYLNRSPDSFMEFNRMMKDKYKLNIGDRINRLVNNIGVIESFLEAFK